MAAEENFVNIPLEDLNRQESGKPTAGPSIKDKLSMFFHRRRSPKLLTVFGITGFLLVLAICIFIPWILFLVSTNKKDNAARAAMLNNGSSTSTLSFAVVQKCFTDIEIICMTSPAPEPDSPIFSGCESIYQMFYCNYDLLNTINPTKAQAQPEICSGMVPFCNNPAAVHQDTGTDTPVPTASENSPMSKPTLAAAFEAFFTGSPRSFRVHRRL